MPVSPDFLTMHNLCGRLTPCPQRIIQTSPPCWHGWRGRRRSWKGSGAKSNAPRTRRTKADRFPKNIKIIVEAVLISEDVEANPNDYDEIGEEHHDELGVIRPQMIWRRTIRKKFVHKNDRSRPPVIAPAPLASIPGTLISPELAAQICTD